LPAGLLESSHFFLSLVQTGAVLFLSQAAFALGHSPFAFGHVALSFGQADLSFGHPVFGLLASADAAAITLYVVENRNTTASRTTILFFTTIS
jgi:hypothetical protein